MRSRALTDLSQATSRGTTSWLLNLNPLSSYISRSRFWPYCRLRCGHSS
jgi:hypothetical protein